MPELYKIPSAEEIKEMYRKIEQNEKEIKRFEADLKKLISGDKKLASSPLLVGKTPASLAICGADGTLDMTITKKVIDKIMSPEIRDSNGQRAKKSGHFLSESQLVSALENMKNPVMVLKGSKDNSLVAITDIQDDKGQQILVSISLSDTGSVDDVNKITSAYGREGFADYMKQQINQHKNVLAYNKEKANDLLLSIGVDFPEANTTISFDNSIAYTTANVKYPQNHKQELGSEKETEIIRQDAYIPELCKAIHQTFDHHYNPDRHILNTANVLQALSEKYNFNDVKSVIAVSIITMQSNESFSEQAKQWAGTQNISPAVKQYTDFHQSVPLNIKSGFLEVFAKKADAWEQGKKAKENSLFSRKEITSNAEKKKEPQKSPQEKTSQHKKSEPSL